MGIRSFFGIIAILTVVFASACPQGGGDSPQGQSADTPARKPSAPRSLSVLCDPLLVDLLSQLESEMTTGLKGYELQAVERGELLRRIADGDSFAGVDVFAVADPQCSAALVEAGLVSQATQRSFAGDRLALVSRQGESWRAASLFDIYRLRFKWLGIGSIDTATGYYAEQALISDGVMPRVEDRLSYPDNAAAILSELLDGQSQMAILPRSMVTGLQDIKLVLLLGRDLHEDFVYQLAAASGLEDDDSVMALLTGLAEDEEIQSLISGYGFDNRSEALGLNVAPE